MKSQTVGCTIYGEAAGEIWNWPLLLSAYNSHLIEAVGVN